MGKYKKGNRSQLIQKKLSEIFLKDSKDPRFQRLTITRVEPSADMSFAKVYFAVYQAEDVEDIENSLNRASGFFSSSLGRSLKTRNTPRLVFVYDKGFDHTSQIEDLLKQVL